MAEFDHHIPPNPYNPHAWVIGDPSIGEGTWIGPFTIIDGSGGLQIGRGCDISSGAQIYTHASTKRCVSGRSYPTVDREPTTIGDYVFIGANAVVQMGVTIGDRAVVSAGAVVTADVPPGIVVSGVPARARARVVITDGDVQYQPLTTEQEQR